MKEFKHVITDPMGMHARPAAMLVKAVAPFASKVTVTAPTGTADARRLMALMKLAAKQGMELTVTVGRQVQSANEPTATESSSQSSQGYSGFGRFPGWGF